MFEKTKINENGWPIYKNHLGTKVPGMVVATAKPTPEKAAHTFKTMTEGKRTVKTIENPKVVMPNK